ncbi:MAG: ATP-binding protein [Treponema sp.]|nr:ATP-binding protein [Treponema sp.]
MITVETLLSACKNQKDLYLSHSRKSVGRNVNQNAISPLPAFARIVTGVRRCGKSTVVQMLFLEKNVFYLNFEDTSLYEFETKDFAILNEAIARYVNETGCNCLCFDEIQSVKDCELFVHRKLEEGFLLVITGSNASLLSWELGTHLTGRHVDCEMFPFSYREFCLLRKCEISDESFSDYLRTGGFPEFIKDGNPEILQRLFDDIITRDIAVRHSIRDIRTLKVLSLYLASNCGNLITGGKLSAHLGLKTSVTVLEYLSFLEQSYLFFYMPKFSYSAKSQAVNPKKVYCIDTGMTRCVTLSSNPDLGRMLENAVFLELRRRTKNIWYYSEAAFECDFLYGSGAVPENAVQVCYELTNENREREVKGLVETCRKFPNVKPVIVTFRQRDKISYSGMIIDVVSATDFFTS